MLGALPRAAFSLLASSEVLRRLADRYGMGRRSARVRSYVAGETLQDAVEAASVAERAGRRVTFAPLAPFVTCAASAAEAARKYVHIIQGSAAPDRDRHLSVKLTQLGLLVDRATALDNLRRLLDAAAASGMFVRLDFDRESTAAVTLDTAETLWLIGYRNLGVVLHAAWRRSLQDAKRVNALGMSARLKKTRHREPPEVAYRDARSIRSAFRALTERLLVGGVQPTIATQEPALIADATQLAEDHNIPRHGFEFVFPLGVGIRLQETLAAQGYRVRTELPFGTEWFPYFMERLGDGTAGFLKLSRRR